MPLKIKVFLWQMFRDRLPSSNNVAKRNGPSDGSCAICGAHEDANHIFFNCHLARFAWSAVREALGQNRTLALVGSCGPSFVLIGATMLEFFGVALGAVVVALDYP